MLLHWKTLKIQLERSKCMLYCINIIYITGINVCLLKPYGIYLKMFYTGNSLIKAYMHQLLATLTRTNHIVPRKIKTNRAIGAFAYLHPTWHGTAAKKWRVFNKMEWVSFRSSASLLVSHKCANTSENTRIIPLICTLPLYVARPLLYRENAKMKTQVT